MEKIFKWHYKMFENYNSKLWKIEIGTFRKEGTMQIVSGTIGKQKVFYEAPDNTQKALVLSSGVSLG